MKRIYIHPEDVEKYKKHLKSLWDSPEDLRKRILKNLKQNMPFWNYHNFRLEVSYTPNVRTARVISQEKQDFYDKEYILLNDVIAEFIRDNGNKFHDMIKHLVQMRVIECQKDKITCIMTRSALEHFSKDMSTTTRTTLTQHGDWTTELTAYQQFKKENNIPCLFTLFGETLLKSPEEIYQTLAGVDQAMTLLDSYFANLKMKTMLKRELVTCRIICSYLCQGREIDYFEKIFKERINLFNIYKQIAEKVDNKIDIHLFGRFIQLLQDRIAELHQDNFQDAIDLQATRFMTLYLEDQSPMLKHQLWQYFNSNRIINCRILEQQSPSQELLIVSRELQLEIAKKQYQEGKKARDFSCMTQSIKFYTHFFKLSKRLSIDLEPEYILDILKTYDCVVRYATCPSDTRSYLASMKRFYTQNPVQEKIDQLSNAETRARLQKQLTYYVNTYFSLKRKQADTTEMPDTQLKRTRGNPDTTEATMTPAQLIQAIKQRLRLHIDAVPNDAKHLISLMQQIEKSHANHSDDHLYSLQMARFVMQIKCHGTGEDPTVNAKISPGVFLNRMFQDNKRNQLEYELNKHCSGQDSAYPGCKQFFDEAIETYLTFLNPQELNTLNQALNANNPQMTVGQRTL